MNEARLWTTAAACFAIVALLGAFVTHRAPSALDVAGGQLRGFALAPAAVFTLLGRWYVLTPLAIVAALATLAWHGDVRIVVVLFASQVIAQGANAVVKELVHRTRPPAWLVYHEPDFSFPSGHAVTSIVFYLGLLLLVLRTEVVPRPFAAPIAIALAVCVVGIPWSRLALDAHYATDVIGGLAFGSGWLCATLALARGVLLSA